LPLFDRLFREYPRQEVETLLGALNRTLRVDPAAVIDDSVLYEETHLDVRTIRRLLILLEASEALTSVIFWKCPNTGATLAEASVLSELPHSLPHCEHCGQTHYLSQRDLEIHFVATPRLRDELTRD
jgi:hypothetical protein